MGMIRTVFLASENGLLANCPAQNQNLCSADGEEDFDEAESDLLGGDDGVDLDDDIGDDEWGLDDSEAA